MMKLLAGAVVAVMLAWTPASATIYKCSLGNAMTAHDGLQIFG